MGGNQHLSSPESLNNFIANIWRAELTSVSHKMCVFKKSKKKKSGLIRIEIVAERYTNSFFRSRYSDLKSSRQMTPYIAVERKNTIKDHREKG